MNPIDEGVKGAIKARAQALEDSGEVVNRRALAREFGVSPQTVARALDGPDARRGEAGGLASDTLGVSQPAALAGILVGLGLGVLSVWAAWRDGRKLRQV